MYEWREENGVMTILDVEVMSRLTADQRADMPEGSAVDDEYLVDLAERTKDRIARGKPPQLLLRHNPDDNNGSPAEVIGRLANPRFNDGWLRADLVVTNPKQQERIKRGELPNKSAEFYLKSRKLWGLSLIEGEEGHFGDLCPDLVLKGTVGEIVTVPEKFVLKHQKDQDTLMQQIHVKPIKLGKRQMPNPADDKGSKKSEGDAKTLKLKSFHSVKLMGGAVEVQATPEAETVTVSEQPTAEEVATVVDAATMPVQSEVEQLKAQIEALKAEIASLKGDAGGEGDRGAVDDETEQLRKQARDDAEAIRLKRQDLELDELVSQVKASGCVLEREQIRTKLKACKTDEGREKEAQLLKLQGKPNAGEVKDNPELKVETDYKTKLNAAFEKSAHKARGESKEDYEKWLKSRGYADALPEPDKVNA